MKKLAITIDNKEYFVLDTSSEYYNPKDNVEYYRVVSRLTTNDIDSNFGYVYGSYNIEGEVAYYDQEFIPYSRNAIIKNLNNEASLWIEKFTPSWKQREDLSRFIFLNMLATSGDADQLMLDEMQYLNSVDNWIIKCRQDVELVCDNFIFNGIKSDLILDDMPNNNL